MSRIDTLDPGQAAYEADVARQPRYHDGTARKTWAQLGDVERWSWSRPTPDHTPSGPHGVGPGETR